MLPFTHIIYIYIYIYIYISEQQQWKQMNLPYNDICQPGPIFATKRHRLTGIGTPIINLRRSNDRLRFIMGIAISIRRCLRSEYRPWWQLVRWWSYENHIHSFLLLLFVAKCGFITQWFYRCSMQATKANICLVIYAYAILTDTKMLHLKTKYMLVSTSKFDKVDREHCIGITCVTPFQASN